jgi:hypothetical protein
MFAATDISHGHSWGADVCFLIAVICAVAAAVLYVLARRARPVAHDRDDLGPRTLHVAAPDWSPVAAALALAFIALGLLIL